MITTTSIEEIKDTVVLKVENRNDNCVSHWTVVFNKYNLDGYAYREYSDTIRLYRVRDTKYGSYINKAFVPQLTSECDIEFGEFCIVFHGDAVFIVKGGEKIGKSSFVRAVNVMKFWRIVIDGFSDNL